MNKKIYLIFFSLFLLSRTFFINTKNVFFDSSEYINLFSNQNYFQAIISGHFPPHEGYIVIFWNVFQIAKILHLNPVYFVILGQILLAFLTIYSFYRLIEFISDKKTAFIASIIISLIPIFWITNVTIMMEIAYVSFFFFSLYFLIKFFANSKKLIFLHLSAFCFTFSFLTHMLVIFWLPLYFAIVYFYKKAFLFKTMQTIIFYIVFASILNLLFISAVSKESILSVFNHLYLSKSGEFAILNFNLHSILVVIRNFATPLIVNNTSLIFILGILSIILSFKKSKKIFIIGLLWITPAIYTNQWWDSLLNGRHALIASFGFAFLVGYLLKKRKILIFIVIIYLLFTSIPILNLLNKSIPYLQEAEFVKSLPRKSLLIETHFARPQVQEIKSLNFFFINEPGFDKNTLSTKIDNYLKVNNNVFISSGALSEPYGLYSGPYLHNITLSYKKSFELESILKNYTLEKYRTINTEDNLIIYKIISKKPSPYPKIKSLKNSQRRIDYYDPLQRFIRGFLPQKP